MKLMNYAWDGVGRIITDLLRLILKRFIFGDLR
ncbi:hypothetical protein SAMN05216334_1681 [Nitrosomonas ureae]|uniref:Uncharacterized protein n=1 Tax=Nitrosomonas ureae TaxID=44577 RepID=A0A1H5YJV9_9PROT|nr:hypothetical protein SAMN05216334_1681 [Nitrosomonas ureae]